MTVEEETSKVYEMIGRALGSWGGIEFALAMLFSTFVSRMPFNPDALIVFFAIDNSAVSFRLLILLSSKE